MARQRTYIQNGFIFRKQDRKELENLFDLNKFLKREIDFLNIPNFDTCCDTAGVHPQPVRVEAPTGALQTFNGTEWVTITAFLTDPQNDIAAGTGGAIPVTNYLTTINTDAGGDTFTLADGTTAGQQKKIRLVVDGGGDGVVTPATPLADASTTITFNDAGDFVTLIWNGTAWAVIENSGTTIA